MLNSSPNSFPLLALESNKILKRKPSFPKSPFFAAMWKHHLSLSLRRPTNARFFRPPGSYLRLMISHRLFVGSVPPFHIYVRSARPINLHYLDSFSVWEHHRINFLSTGHQPPTLRSSIPLSSTYCVRVHSRFPLHRFRTNQIMPSADRANDPTFTI